MKIIREEQPRMSIEEFADKHDLVMKVVERPLHIPARSWYARFVSAEVKEGGVLKNTFGDGATPEEAIRNYAIELNSGGRILVIDALLGTRKEILMPYFTEGM